MFGKMIGNIVSKVVGEEAGVKVIEYFDKKQELKQELKLAKIQGKIQAEKAKAQYKAQKLKKEGQWSRLSIQNSGLKDEFVLMIISIPLIMAAFVPQRVLETFQTLQETPEWYRYMVVTIFLAVYGIKPSIKWWKGHK